MVEEVHAGVRGDLGDAQWSVLWPARDEKAFPPGNDLSVVVEIAGGGVPRSLYLGDLSAESQNVLLRSQRVRGVYPVVKVSHHGSGDQAPALYEQITATIGLIGVGAENDYGHPRDEALAMLETVGATVLRTDLDGRVLLGAGSDGLEIWRERGSP